MARVEPKSVKEMIEAARAAGHDALGIANDPEAIRTIQKIGYARTDTYDIEQCAAFLKTKEKWGGLSNMAGGFPIKVMTSDTMFGHVNHEIRSTEALYQACRFPDHPEIQKEIVDNKSPMGAKMVAKREKNKSRQDWHDINIDIMRWCLQLKWVHSEKFRAELKATGEMPVVEISYKDPFWGAKPDGTGKVVGQNVLGKLLMELRAWAHDDVDSLITQICEEGPPEIDNFKLFGADIV